MHPSLLLDEIQRLIFKSLEPRDLGQLARTCKAFFHAATDELWKTVRTLSPFVSCLPPDFQYRYRTLHVEDLQRYDFYLPKVQNLFLESETGKPLQLPFQFRWKSKNKPRMKTWDELWAEIGKLRPKLESLLNLRRLRISNVQDRHLVPLVGISGSNLTQIRVQLIHNRRTPSVILKVLDGLITTPRLESLAVGRDEAHFVDLARVSPLKHLRLEPRIRCMSLEYYHSPLLYEVLQKSTLKSLTLCLTRDWNSPEITALKNKYLPSLKILWLNLAAFDPNECAPSCGNINSNWTCRSYEPPYKRTLHPATNCGRRSPTVFLKGLDNPELSLLNIKFPIDITGKKFLDVVSAAVTSCRVMNLTELALVGGGWRPHRHFMHRPRPQIPPKDLRTSLSMFLPLPQLKVLRLSVAPNFLDVLDRKLYRSLTAGLPALEKLSLGHAEFYSNNNGDGPEDFCERVSLYHLAAFCSRLPNIKEVSVGTIDGQTLEKRPRPEWACVGVEALRISHYVDVYRGENLDLLILGLRTYFPNSGLADNPLYRREYRFRR